MASLDQAVTTDPVALAATAEGTQYAIQNLGTTPVYAAVAAAEPARGKRTFTIPPLDFLYQSHGSGESIWVWVGDGASHVAYEESS